MKKTILFLVFFSSIVFADTVWTFPFSELGADWELEYPWVVNDTGAIYSTSYDDVDLAFVYRSFNSGLLTVPESIDSITIEFYSGYEYDGYAMDGGSYISISAEVDTGVAPYSLVDVYDGLDSYNYASYEGSDTTLVWCVLPYQTGDTFELDFTGGVYTYGYIAGVNLYWSVWDMTITGHGGTSLNRYTWAEIKSSFL